MGRKLARIQKGHKLTGRRELIRKFHHQGAELIPRDALRRRAGRLGRTTNRHQDADRGLDEDPDSDDFKAFVVRFSSLVAIVALEQTNRAAVAVVE